MTIMIKPAKVSPDDLSPAQEMDENGGEEGEGKIRLRIFAELPVIFICMLSYSFLRSCCAAT